MAFFRKTLTPKVQIEIDRLLSWKIPRPLADIKRLRTEHIVLAIQEFLPSFSRGNLWDHQISSILLGLEREKLGIWLDPGLGKTYVALEILRIRRAREEKIGRTLIIVPSVANLSEWKKQISEWSDLSCLILNQPGRDKKLRAIESSTDMYAVITYPSLQALLKDKRYKRYRVEPDTMGVLLYQFNSVISDESHKAKNRNTNIFKCLDILSENVGPYLALTGTPMNSLPDVWAQSVLIDGGESLGRTWPVFENGFFTPRLNFHGSVDLIPFPETESDIKERVETFSIRYSADECQDLPDLLAVRIPVSMPPAQRTRYDLVRKSEDLSDLALTKSRFNNLRAITSGYVKTIQVNPVTEERSEKIEVFKNNPKLDWVIDFLRNNNGSIIVWANFIATQSLIGKALKKEKIGHILYRESKNKMRDLEKFISGEIKVIIANPGSLGTGTNLQNSHCMIFFEAELSSIVRKQSEKRIHRGGQTSKCVIYDLVMENSIDENISESVRDGVSLLKRVIDGEIDMESL